MPASVSEDNLTALSETVIRVWTIPLDAEWATTDALENVLSGAERERASRFLQAAARRRYSATRIALRHILSELVGVPAAALTFQTTSTGRPFLSQPGETGIDFNVSHTGSHALIAASRGRRVGVDIELIRPLANEEALVARLFSEEEQQEFRALPSEVRTRAFFSTWTRKEAFVKATGVGITDVLHRFAVTVNPDEAPRLLRVDWPEEEVAAWGLVDLPPPEGLASALAIEGWGWHLDLRLWNPTV